MRRHLMWIFALVVASANDPRAHEPLEIVVRLYPSDVVSPAPPRALSVATTILGDAGVRVTWMPCGSGSHRAAACDSVMTSTDLALRMIRGDNDSNTPLRALGYALIDRQQDAGVFATVFADRVGLLARESGVDASQLLGRAIAHEIGHLLMGTNQHSASGVMRALWTRRDLRRDRPDQWRFTPAQMAAICDHNEPPLVARR
jgi:hypothetical protein